MTAPIYARTTDVSVEQSRHELDTLLGRHGADLRLIADLTDRAVVGFRLAGQTVRIEVPMPTLAMPGATPDGWEFLVDKNRQVFIAQQTRARWRSLLLLVKAKLEAVRIGLTSVEREFRPDLLPSTCAHPMLGAAQ